MAVVVNQSIGSEIILWNPNTGNQTSLFFAGENRDILDIAFGKNNTLIGTINITTPTYEDEDQEVVNMAQIAWGPMGLLTITAIKWREKMKTLLLEENFPFRIHNQEIL